MRAVIEWVIVKIASVVALVLIPDVSDDIWADYEREGR